MRYSITDRGVHKVKVTLQFEDYVGHIFTEIGGNCHGLRLLHVFDFDTETEFDTPYISNDCKLQYNEGTDSFSCTLKNDESVVLVLDDMSSDEMNNMIVGLEIIDFRSGEEG